RMPTAADLLTAQGPSGPAQTLYASGITGGMFDSGADWLTRGAVAFADGRATLSEDDRLSSDLSPSFTLPGNRYLAFDIVSARFDAPGGAPNDAFEVALLDAATHAPVTGVISLTHADSLLNIQSDGHIYRGAGVQLLGLTGDQMPASLQRPLTVAIDVSALVAGKAVSLYFDLLGFGARGSQVVLDNVRFVDLLNRPPQATDDTARPREDAGRGPM